MGRNTKPTTVSGLIADAEKTYDTGGAGLNYAHTYQEQRRLLEEARRLIYDMSLEAVGDYAEKTQIDKSVHDGLDYESMRKAVDDHAKALADQNLLKLVDEAERRLSNREQGKPENFHNWSAGKQKTWWMDHAYRDDFPYRRAEVSQSTKERGSFFGFLRKR